VSIVSQVSIYWTTTGWSPPMMTPPLAGSPITTSRVLRRWKRNGDGQYCMALILNDRGWVSTL
jgi:hypothetical protein